MADFTVAGSMAGLDRAAVLRALGSAADRSDRPRLPADPVVAAIVELRSGDLLRIRAALRDPPRDPLLIGALVPLLARDDLVRTVVVCARRVRRARGGRNGLRAARSGHA